MSEGSAPHELLADLDSVDWSATWDAYGPAGQVPQYLRGLASNDQRIQDWALGQLSTTIGHQGSDYPAAIEALPFLAEPRERWPQINADGRG